MGIEAAESIITERSLQPRRSDILGSFDFKSLYPPRNTILTAPNNRYRSQGKCKELGTRKAESVLVQSAHVFVEVVRCNQDLAQGEAAAHDHLPTERH